MPTKYNKHEQTECFFEDTQQEKKRTFNIERHTYTQTHTMREQELPPGQSKEDDNLLNEYFCYFV